MTNVKRNKKEHCNCKEDVIIQISHNPKCNKCFKEHEEQDSFDQEGNKLDKPGYKKEEHSRLQNEFNEEYVNEYNNVK